MLIDLLARAGPLRRAIAHKRDRAFAPTPDLTTDEWADTYHIVPKEMSACPRSPTPAPQHSGAINAVDRKITVM